MSGTATRTISQPAARSSLICRTVASTSQVLVLHMDCTVTGALPPTLRLPTLSSLVISRVYMAILSCVFLYY